MTVSASMSKVSYAGNGSTTVFTFPFRIFAETDVRVVLRDTNDVDTVQTITTHYTVSSSPWTSGGTITMVTAPASGETLVIKPDIEATQPVDYTMRDRFPAETHEAALDRLTLIARQILEQLSRTLQLQESTDISGFTMPDPVSGQVLTFDGSDFAWTDVSTLSPGTVVTTAYTETLLAAASAAAALTTLGVSAYAQTLLDDTTEADARGTLGLTRYDGKNFLVNGSFQIAQLGTTLTSTTTPANNDGFYMLDQVTLLSDGNDVFDVSQETNTAWLHPGVYNGITLDVETADLKGGILMLLDAKRSAALYAQGNGVCSLGFTARTSAVSLTKIRAAVLAWSGAADTVIRDCVSAWGAEDSNPTLIANWTYENTPAALTDMSTTPQRYTIEDIQLDTASTANIGVFIWLDDMTNNLGNLCTISAAQLEAGPYATDYVQPSYSDELYACQEFLQVWTRQSTSDTIATGYHASDVAAQLHLPFMRPMRTAPTMSVSNVGHFLVQRGSQDTTNLTANTSLFGARLTASFASSGFTAGEGATLQFDATAGAYIRMRAEI